MAVVHVSWLLHTKSRILLPIAIACVVYTNKAIIISAETRSGQSAYLSQWDHYVSESHGSLGLS